jgi:hypothetical protein
MDDYLHNSVVRYASELGRHPTDVAAELIAEGLKAIFRQKRNPGIGGRIFVALRQAKERDMTRVRLQQIAVAALRAQDEEALDEFAQLCQDAGVSHEEIISDAKRLENIPIEFDAEDGVSSCMMFVYEMLKEGPVPSTVAQARAEGAGFSRRTIQAARRGLNVKASRGSSCWIWQMPEGLMEVEGGRAQ